MATSFEAPRDFLDASTRTGALDDVGSFGIHSVRIVMYWKDVAPSPNSATKPDFDTTAEGSYDWSRYDDAVTAAHDRGWQVLLTVSGPVPRWATRARRDNVTNPDPSEFAQFMTAVGRHFGSRVTRWSIWNEPNVPQFLRPQYTNGRVVSGRIYRQLFRAGLRGLAAAKLIEPQVLFGETEPRGTGKDVAPLIFLRQALCLDAGYHRDRDCGKLPIAGYAHHAYTTHAGPRFRPPSLNDVTIGVLSRLTTALDRAAKAGAIPAHTPIALTEFGIQSVPDPVYGVSLQRQEEYRNLSERIAWFTARVTSFSQYLLRDDLPAAGQPLASRYPGFESGLETSAGKRKPAFDGFRIVLSAVRKGAKVSLWGLVRPAGGVTAATVQYRSGASGAWRDLAAVTTDADSSFTRTVPFVAGRQYRLAWTSPEGTAFRGGPIRPIA